ncbi:carbohydrate kinase [Isoptericola variabilis]|uniref:Fructokinase n=1 Tax=Isoptericola variabilis (strain 225) TaxID=743718 RepID=F6FQ43_ISOV2|nr:carbohydrate kinase [Isoptericola variabilis]AEG44849.1 Fructokinase [Isoptericola variabilis 225]TWH31627.1 fructokinase [Isoptericola variabilis J7]
MGTDVEFLVVGESVVDRVRTAAGQVAAHPGGSPANVAYGLGRLGNAVAFLTELGPDADGDAVRAHLESAGVRVTAASVPRTPSATAELDHHGAARYDFDIAWTLPKPSVAVRPAHVHVGSIAAYLPPGADAVETVLRERTDGATASFDPNVRPALLGDMAAVRDRTERLLALSDVVKASDEDLEWLQPGRDPLAVAREWLDAGPSLVVVTRGALGSWAVTRHGEFEVPAVRVPVADTVGAGDSCMAALLDGLWMAGLAGPGRRDALSAATTSDLRPLLERAARAAAITVSRPGAQPPTAQELSAVP